MILESSRRPWAMVALLGLLATGPIPARADATCDGVRMPVKEQAFGVNLVLNGMGIRRASIFNIHVYVAGLYVERRTRNATQILRTDTTKAITMEFLRDADRERANDTMRESVEKNAGRRKEAALRSLKQFQQLLPPVRKGNRLGVAYRPGYGLEVRLNGKVRGVYKDDEFAELIFNTWIGPTPSDDDLKIGLLGGACE